MVGSTTKDSLHTYLSSQKPYDTSVVKYNKPCDCELVHINHLGRHGSRYFTSVSKLAGVNQTLEKLGINRLSAAKILTSEGQSWFSAIQQLLVDYQLHPDLVGGITALGKIEQSRIATRMVQNTKISPAVLFKPGNLHIRVSKKRRACESANAFLGALNHWANLKIDHDFIRSADNEPDPLLGFQFCCDKWLNVKDQVYQSIEKERQQFSQRRDVQAELLIMADSLLVSLPYNYESLYKMAYLTYKTCQMDKSLPENEQFGFCDYFYRNGQKLLKLINEHENRLHSLKLGEYVVGSINPEMAVLLLKDWLDAADVGVSGKGPMVNLRFASDSIIVRFLQLLGLFNCNSNNTSDFSSVVPMSANIQCYLYDCSGATYAQLLWNEKVVKFPIPGCNDTLCRWDTVRDHYRKIINQIDWKGLYGNHAPFF